MSITQYITDNIGVVILVGLVVLLIVGSKLKEYIEKRYAEKKNRPPLESPPLPPQQEQQQEQQGVEISPTGPFGISSKELPEEVSVERKYHDILNHYKNQLTEDIKSLTGQVEVMDTQAIELNKKYKVESAVFNNKFKELKDKRSKLIELAKGLKGVNYD